MKPRIELLVTDLDNTLYDWVTFFATAVYEMVDVAVGILDVPRERLLDELQAVHRYHHNSEQPFALLETDAVRQRLRALSREEQAARLDQAFHAFNAARKRTLRLYPGVTEVFEEVTRQGARIVAHTQATITNAQFRLSKLHVASFISRLYAAEHHGGPHPMPSKQEHLHEVTEVRALSRGERKPDPRILLNICADFGVPPNRVVYVGDSVPQDIGMAKAAGAWAAWARYGTEFDRSHWEGLIRITHWTADDLCQVQMTSDRHGHYEADVVLHESYAELLKHFEFVQWRGNADPGSLDNL